MPGLRSIVGKLPGPLKNTTLELARRIRIRGFAIPDPLDDLQRLSRFREPQSILDIGAHHGQTAVELRRHFPNTTVHCFEPFPTSHEILTRNVARLGDVETHALAISDSNGTATFYANSNSQTNSLLDNDIDNEKMAATAHEGQITVTTRTLDSFAAKSLTGQRVIIKADVQGAELSLIKGGEQTLANQADVFYTEVSLGKLYKNQGDLFSIHQAMTEKLPFVLFQIYRTRSDRHGRALWADAMWIHKDFAAQLDTTAS